LPVFALNRRRALYETQLGHIRKLDLTPIRAVTDHDTFQVLQIAAIAGLQLHPDLHLAIGRTIPADFAAAHDDSENSRQ
jgi:hypothetical protein